MRTRDQLMEQWDAIRSQIASGHTSDGPRIWLEGVLDDYDSALADAERRARETQLEYGARYFDLDKSQAFTVDMMRYGSDRIGYVVLSTGETVSVATFTSRISTGRYASLGK